MRSRKEGDLGPMAFADFMQKLGDEVASRVR